MSTNIEKHLSSLAKKEGMDDLSIFFRPYETFEEIPVFSFFDNISFLSGMNFNEKNKIIIKYAIDLLIKIRAFYGTLNGISKRECFFCISIRDWDIDDYEEINCVTPCIYISTKKIWLTSCAKLIERNSIEEYLVLEYLSSIGETRFKIKRARNNEEITRIYML